MNPKTQLGVDILISQSVLLRCSEERLKESVPCTAIALTNWAPQSEGVRGGNLVRFSSVLKKKLPMILPKQEDWKIKSQCFAKDLRELATLPNLISVLKMLQVTM